MKNTILLILATLTQSCIASDAPSFPICAEKIYGATTVSFSLNSINATSVADVTWCEKSALSDRPFENCYHEEWQLDAKLICAIKKLHLAKKTDLLCDLLFALATPPEHVIKSYPVEDFACSTWE